MAGVSLVDTLRLDTFTAQIAGHTITVTDSVARPANRVILIDPSKSGSVGRGYKLELSPAQIRQLQQLLEVALSGITWDDQDEIPLHMGGVPPASALRRVAFD